MANDRVLNTRLRFLTEKADITRARGDIAALERAYEDLEHAQRTNDVIADALTSSLNEQGAAMRRVAAASKTTTAGGGGLTGIERGKRVGDLGSLLSATGGLNALGGSGAIFQELGQLGDIAQYLPQAAEGFSQLAASLGTSTTGLIGAVGIAAVGVVALGIAIQKGIIEPAEKTKRLLEVAAKAQENYFNALGEFTAEEAQAEIDANIRKIEASRAQLAESEAKLEEARRAVRESPIGDAGVFTDELVKLYGGGEFITSVEEQRKAIQELEFTNARLTDGLNAGAFAANDAAEAEKALAEERERNSQLAIEGFNRVRGAEREAQGFLETATSDTLKKRLDALAQERAQLDEDLKYYQSLETDAGRAAAEANRQRATEIDIWSMTLQVGQDAVAQRERELASLQKFVTTGAALVKGLVSGLEGVAALSEKRAETIAKTQAALDDLAAKNAERLADIETSRTEAIADAYQTQRETQLKAQEDFNKAQADAERDYRAELKRIQRDSSRELSDAIANRDVLAYKQAKQSRDDQLEDAKESLAEQQRVNREAYQQQLKDAAATARKQIQLANDAARKQIELANRAYQQELNNRQAALNAELQLIQQAAQAEITLRNQVNSATLAGLTILRNQVMSLFGGSSAGSLISTVGSVVGAATGSGLISGAAGLIGGLFNSSSSAAAQPRAAAGAPTINVFADTKATALRQLSQILGDILD